MIHIAGQEASQRPALCGADDDGTYLPARSTCAECNRKAAETRYDHLDYSWRAISDRHGRSDVVVEVSTKEAIEALNAMKRERDEARAALRQWEPRACSTGNIARGDCIHPACIMLRAALSPAPAQPAPLVDPWQCQRCMAVMESADTDKHECRPRGLSVPLSFRPAQPATATKDGQAMTRAYVWERDGERAAPPSPAAANGRGSELLNTLSLAYSRGPGEAANVAFSELLDYVVGLERIVEGGYSSNRADVERVIEAARPALRFLEDMKPSEGVPSEHRILWAQFEKTIGELRDALAALDATREGR